MQPHRSCDSCLLRTPLLQHAQAWPPNPTPSLQRGIFTLPASSFAGAKSQLLHLKLGLGEVQAGFTFSFQTVDQVAFLLSPINLTQHFNGKTIHPGHGGPRLNSLLHLREDKLIYSEHPLAIRLHKGTFSSSLSYLSKNYQQNIDPESNHCLLLWWPELTAEGKEIWFCSVPLGLLLCLNCWLLPCEINKLRLPFQGVSQFPSTFLAAVSIVVKDWNHHTDKRSDLDLLHHKKKKRWEETKTCRNLPFSSPQVKHVNAPQPDKKHSLQCGRQTATRGGWLDSKEQQVWHNKSTCAWSSKGAPH